MSTLSVNGAFRPRPLTKYPDRHPLACAALDRTSSTARATSRSAIAIATHASAAAHAGARPPPRARRATPRASRSPSPSDEGARAGSLRPIPLALLNPLEHPSQKRIQRRSFNGFRFTTGLRVGHGFESRMGLEAPHAGSAANLATVRGGRFCTGIVPRRAWVSRVSRITGSEHPVHASVIPRLQVRSFVQRGRTKDSKPSPRPSHHRAKPSADTWSRNTL